MNAETHTEPPCPVHDDGGDDEPLLSANIAISEPDGTYRSANCILEQHTDDALAAALVSCLRAIAAHRGQGLQLALHKRIREV